MEENKNRPEIDETKTIELNEVKTKDLPKVKEEIEKAKENAKNLKDTAELYMEVPTLQEGFNKKIQEIDRTIAERNMKEVKIEEKKVKKPSIIKRIFGGIKNFFKKLFGGKKKNIENSIEFNAQDMPKVKEELEKAKENKKKLEEMYEPYKDYPKFDGTEGQEKSPKIVLETEKYDIQMEEVDDGQDK